MQTRHFCTLFDRNYLLKGVAMLESLFRHCPRARVFVLCMDAQTRTILERLQVGDIVCIDLSELEDEALLEAKANRSVAEYCWTLSPCLPWYVLQQYSEVDEITYLDADLLFYSPLAPLFEEIGAASIAIIEHRFTPRLRHLEINGRFCVEWVSFRRDAEGLACLSRWREQCIEWCYYRLEDGRMGDQKYLDEWPARYPSCHIIQHPGAGIAPWNYAQYRFDGDVSGAIAVQGQPLIFYHFHQFQLLDDGRFERLSDFYTMECREPHAVYAAYESALRGVLARVRALEPGFSGGLMPSPSAGRRWLRHAARFAKSALYRLRTGASGR